MQAQDRLVNLLLLIGLSAVPAVGQAPSAPPNIKLPARYSYAAKFVCGWEAGNSFRYVQSPPLVHTEPGHYSTIVNIHNPWAKTVTIRKKVVVSAHEEEVPDSKSSPPFKDAFPPVFPTIRFQETIQSDQSISVDCTEIQNLLALTPNPPVTPTTRFEEGWVIVDAFFPQQHTSTAAQLDVTTVTTTAAYRLTSGNAAASSDTFTAYPVVVWDQISLDHEVTTVPGRLLPAGEWPDGGPPLPPPSSAPGPTNGLDLYVCLQMAISAGAYGAGYATTHPQHCSDIKGFPLGPPPDLTVPSSVATDIGKTVPTPWGASTKLFKCNFFNPSSALYGAGVIVALPQFCSTSGIVEKPAPPPVPVPGGPPAAVQTGWTAGGDPIWRCTMATRDLNAFDGIGVLTTNAQHCDDLATYPPTVPKDPGVAADTGLKVP